jgi:hypothetical protein
LVVWPPAGIPLLPFTIQRPPDVSKMIWPQYPILF